MEDIKQQAKERIECAVDNALEDESSRDWVVNFKQLLTRITDESISLAVKQERELSYKKGYSDGFNSRMI